MPLNEEIRLKDVKRLTIEPKWQWQQKVTAIINRGVDLQSALALSRTTKVNRLLDEITKLAAQDEASGGLSLTRQGEKPIHELFSRIALNIDVDKPISELAKTIYQPFISYISSLGRSEVIYWQHGDFETQPLHQSPPDMELTEIHIKKLQPNLALTRYQFDESAIENQDVSRDASGRPIVLTEGSPLDIIDAIRRDNYHGGIDAILKPSGLPTSLSAAHIKTIIIPVGPGHWRNIIIHKSEDKNFKLDIEIFDSMGPGSAKELAGLVHHLLRSCELTLNRLRPASLPQLKLEANTTLRFVGPKNPQRGEGYSCGDYVIANMHQIALAMGLPGSEVDIVRTLEEKGNQKGALRTTMQEHSAKIYNEPLAIAEQGATFSISQLPSSFFHKKEEALKLSLTPKQKSPISTPSPSTSLTIKDPNQALWGKLHQDNLEQLLFPKTSSKKGVFSCGTNLVEVLYGKYKTAFFNHFSDETKIKGYFQEEIDEKLAGKLQDCYNKDCIAVDEEAALVQEALDELLHQGLKL